MKKIYQNPSFMVVALNTRHSILGTSGDPQPDPPVDPTNPVDDESGSYTKRYKNVWDDDWN
jgi:hypothetical protein